ncbi:MAG: hypothetical protein ABI456_04290 [Ktedonobacteraceae bacterium]
MKYLLTSDLAKAVGIHPNTVRRVDSAFKEEIMVPVNPYIIRANPLLPGLKTLLISWYILLGLFLALFIFAGFLIVISRHSSVEASQSLSHGSWYLFIFLMCSLSFVTTFLQYRYWKRIEQRRMAAAGRDPSTFAAEQPIANPLALQLPFTITLRAGKVGMVVFFGIMLGFSLVFAAYTAWLTDMLLFVSADRLYAFLGMFTLSVVFSAVLFLVIFLTPLGNQKIEVTEQGVSTFFGSQKGMVRWEEARLFAMYNAWGARKNGYVVSYELSSATHIARWSRPMRQGSLRMRMVPAMSFTDYSSRMQALNELIVARTRLPLCDLRSDHALTTRSNLNPV